MTTQARIVSGGGVEPGCRALEQEHEHQALKIRVDVSQLSADDGALIAALDDNDLIATGRAEAADLRIYRIEPRTSAEPDDPVPQVPRVDASSWAVVDAQGLTAMPLKATSEGPATVVENIERLARYRNAIGLDNPDGKLALDFKIYRQLSNEEWIEAAPDEGQDAPVFEAGDKITFEVTNRENRSVFVSILDFGLTGRIALLYPPQSTSEELVAGQTLRIGAGGELSLGLPDGFDKDAGVETFKLFATTAETDFSWLQQSGVRSAGTDDGSTLMGRFRAAFDGSSTRDATLQAPTPATDWIASNCTFVLTAGSTDSL